MDGPTTERIKSKRDIELALHHFGGAGPVLMICHATGFHAHCYRPMLPLLTQHFDVWGIDFGGHGDSDAPAEDDFAWSGFAADLLGAIDHMGAAPVKVFAHSMGGAAALLAEVDRPGIIEEAWLYEPIIFPAEIGPRNSFMADNARRRRREFASKAEALQRYASRPPLGMLRADALAAYVDGGFHETETGTVTLACAPEHEALVFNAAHTTLRDVSTVQTRAVIACGESIDEPNPAQFAPPVAEGLANAELQVCDRLGHFGPLQDPDRIARYVIDFMA